MNNPEEMVVCPECGGIKTYYSCCGDEIDFDDDDDVVHCPTCHEPCVMDDALEDNFCDVCGGSGEITQRQERAYHKENLSYERADEDRT